MEKQLHTLAREDNYLATFWTLVTVQGYLPEMLYSLNSTNYSQLTKPFL